MSELENVNKIGSLEEEALKRKERLKALNKKKNEIEEQNETKSEPLPKPKFRSYVPQNEALQENVLPKAKPGNVDEEIKDQLEAAKSRVVLDEFDITNLAPRKPDWDLKRDVAKKLEKLEKRTQIAIAELIRDRLKQDQEDLVTSVTVGAEANQMEVDDDD